MSNINPNNVPHELDWDSEIESDSSFVMLPTDGEYSFTVVGFERGTFPGSEKIPQCKSAQLTLEIPYNGQTVNVKTSLILYSTMEWKISEFFRSIGMKKHGERVSMNWNKVLGSSGRCTIRHREGKNGNKYNDIDKFLDFDPSAPVAKTEEAPF